MYIVSSTNILIQLIAEASRLIWVELEKARHYSRIAYANGVDEVGEWRSIDDPNLCEADALKLSLKRMLCRRSVPIIIDIFKEIESFVSTAREGTRSLLKLLSLFGCFWVDLQFTVQSHCRLLEVRTDQN